MSAIATGGKFCCKCGADVTNAKRMKDSGGRYWCVACAAQDKERQAASVGLTCSVCGDVVPTSQTTKLGGSIYCGKCSKEQKRADGAGFSVLSDVGRNIFEKGGGSSGTKKAVIGLVILVVVVIGVYYLMHRS